MRGDEAVEYNNVMKELKPISIMLQKSLMREIKTRQRNSTDRGLLMGNRIDHTSYYRNDGKIFTKRNRPDEQMDLSVGVLVDQSGSMSGERIRMARLMAMVVYDFCRSMNIPITIYGHSCRKYHVSLYSYAEFDSIDGNDKYRLLHMYPEATNRDGCAVRYVANKLVDRTEKTKLFIIVSDGQPNDADYCGTAAEADLRSIRKEYTRRGITFLAVAIGSDKPAIKRCYGEDAFLDITDLKMFPITIAKLIFKAALM